jgi:REP element-mobilizing transposase RayT
MSNHIHLIAGAKEGFHLSNILRDFKKFTSKNIVCAIAENPAESRKKWMLNRFEFAGRFDNKITDYKFWKEGNEAKEIQTNSFLDQKLDYIHNNPVKAEIVTQPEDYLYSSARDYAGEKGLLDIELIN